MVTLSSDHRSGFSRLSTKDGGGKWTDARKVPDRQRDRAAFMYSLIVTARMNDVDPQAWLGNVLARIANTPQNRPGELLPWNWHGVLARLAA